MFKKPVRDAPAQNPSTPTNTESVWAWDLISDVVPSLPCGAVTLIVLSEENPLTSHAATVGDLMTTLVMTEKRFAYVVVGEPDSDMTEGLVATLNEEASEGRVIAYIDRDYKVMARLGDGGGYIYPCGIPSLDNVDRFLAADQHGADRLVILDGFERARPYRADGLKVIPEGVPMSADDIDAWRTADLRAFAQARPYAPTVVVWHAASVESLGTKRSVGDAADVLLIHREGDQGGWLSVNVRSEHGCREDGARG